MRLSICSVVRTAGRIRAISRSRALRASISTVARAERSQPLAAGGPWVSGSAEIRQFEAEFYRAPGYRAWNLTIDEIRFLAPDAVLVEISSTTTIDGGGLSDRMTLVVVRQGAEWKIAAVRIMNVEEQPP